VKPSKFKVVTDAPKGKNHDPSVHSDLNGVGLSVYEFAVLAHSAYCARRKNGNVTTSHPTVAKACSMSPREVQRAREALAGPKRFLTLTGTASGVTNTYVLTEKMQWGASGCKLWLPEELWNLKLNPYELRLYCYYVSQARGTGRVVIDRDEIDQCCGITAPKQRTTDAGLMAAGLIALTGYEDKKPVLELRLNSEWVSLENRKPLTYAEAKRNVRLGLEGKQNETSGQGVTAKRNVRLGKKKPQSTKSNPVIKKPFNAKKGFEVKEQKPLTAIDLFKELLGLNFKGFYNHLNRTGDADTELEQWVVKFGETTIRGAWRIIRETETPVDVQPRYSYPKNTRLINFCRDKLDGIYDPPELCELHNKATFKTPTFVRVDPTPTEHRRDWSDVEFFVPRAQRARARREAEAA